MLLFEAENRRFQQVHLITTNMHVRYAVLAKETWYNGGTKHRLNVCYNIYNNLDVSAQSAMLN